MIDNKTIASTFSLLGKLMELHDENPFKYKAYNNAYNTLRKFEGSLATMTEDELSAITGIGKAIASKIKEIANTGTLSLLENFRNKTPEGVIELLNIRGLGPKKVRQLWDELSILSPGELLYACEENRLIELKGFGQKSQENIRDLVNFYLNNRGQFLFAAAEPLAHDLIEKLKKEYPGELIAITGEMRRLMPIISQIDILVTFDPATENVDGFEKNDTGDLLWHGIKLNFIKTKREDFYQKLFLSSASKDFLNQTASWDILDTINEETIFDKNKAAYILPEYRETERAIQEAYDNKLPKLISVSDIKGIIHNHSTYSDGLHTLSEMADYTQANGYAYLVMSEHSKSAFYANGLTEERVEMQWREIDQINSVKSSFKIYKGIECDILNDGTLDYSDDFLKGFEVVIASIHSNLKMDKNHAMERLLRAISHPQVHILGHPTGRLLLARSGYEIDHAQLIDECAKYSVALELNANPQRLDLDWKWISYAIDKGVYISINPDAHSRQAIHHIKYGVNVARKGGLTAENCLNHMNTEQFEAWLQKKKK